MTEPPTPAPTGPPSALPAPGTTYSLFARERRRDLVAGYWFVTVGVALLGPVLAGVVLAVDKHAGGAGLFPALIISPDSARTILGTIASSLITVASLTASLTIVTLQLLSSQYTPRAVRGFLRKRIAQTVSGWFIAIFVYSLLLLVSVRAPGDENEPFVPSLGIAVAVLGALVGLVLLVVFIHNLAQTIQVSTMTADIADETARAIATTHPHPWSAPPPVPPRSTGLGTPGVVLAGRSGYVQRTRLPLRLPTAVTTGELALLVQPGDFVTGLTPVATWAGPAPMSEAIRRAVRGSILVGHERDIDQDPGFGVRQLVDISLRALSPGINDPSTAVTCLGYLRGLYESLAARALPELTHTHEGGVLVTSRERTLEDYLEPMTEVAAYAVTDTRVMTTVLEVLAAAAESSAAVGAQDRCTEVRALAEDIAGPVRSRAETQHDHGALRRVLDRIERA